MRPTEYLRSGLQNIIKQPVRSLLTILSIAISGALFVALVSLSIDGRDVVMKKVGSDASMTSVVVSSSSMSGNLFGSSVQIAQDSPAKITDETVSALRDLDHVTGVAIQTNIWELKKFTVQDTTKTFVARVSAGSPRTALAAGTWFDMNSTAHEVVIGKSYLDTLGIKNPTSVIGKTISFETTPGYRGDGAHIPAFTATKTDITHFATTPTFLTATIVGVTDNKINDSQLYVPISWGRAIQTARFATTDGERTEDLQAKNGYSSLVVSVDSKDNVPGVVNRIEAMGYGASSYQRQIEQLNQLLFIVWIILGSVALIGMISAALGIVNALLMTVNEQRSTIHIWRACGASRGLIARLFVVQACVIGLIGGALGGIIGGIVTLAIHSYIVRLLAAQGITLSPAPHHLTLIIVIAILTTTTLAVIAGIRPAYIAARRTIQ